MKLLYVIGCVFSIGLLQLQAADLAAPQPIKPGAGKHPTRPDSPFPQEMSSSLQVKPLGMYFNGLPVVAESIPPVVPVQSPDEMSDLADFLGQLSLPHQKKSRLEASEESSNSWVVCAYLMGNLMQVWKRTSVELATATDDKAKEQLAKKIKEVSEQIEGVMHIAAQTNPVFKHLRNAYHGKKDGVDESRVQDHGKGAAA